MMGGYGPRGYPNPSVTHLGPTSLPRPLPRLPPSFPMGGEGMSATRMGGTVIACSAGAAKAPNPSERLFG